MAAAAEGYKPAAVVGGSFQPAAAAEVEGSTAAAEQGSQLEAAYNSEIGFTRSGDLSQNI